MENMFFLTLQFAILLFLGYFWYRFLQWTPEEGLAFAVMSTIIIILVAGFLGCIKFAVSALWAVSGLGFLLFLAGNRVLPMPCSKKESVRLSFFTPGIIMLFCVFLYGMFAFRGLIIHNWDELHQWGKAVNYMLHNNALPMGEGFDGESVLLSTTTMFHYFVCKLPKVLSGEIMESNMYVSNLILWFSAVILPLAGTKWKDWIKCFLYGATVFLAMNILFVQPYYNIYCDQPLTMWSGALIIWYILTPKKENRRLFAILSLFSISMFKNMMGPLFCVVIILAMVIVAILEKEETFVLAVKKLVKQSTIKDYIYSLTCLSSIFLISILWSRKIGENALIRGDGVLKTADDRLKLTLKSGLSKWFQPVNLSASFPNLTFFLYLLLVVFLTFVIVRFVLVGKHKKEYFVLMSLYSFGFFAFFSLMIYTYLTTFSYADSIITGSLNRYFSDYMLLGLIPLMYPLICLNENTHIERKAEAWIAVPLLIFAVSTTNNFSGRALALGVKDGHAYQENVRISSYRQILLNWMDDEKRIYMINQDSNGGYTVFADYTFGRLLDRANMCYYFSKESQSIAGLANLNIRMLPKVLLQDYGYLWIYKSDSYFNEKAFGILKIKEPENGDFYKVTEVNGRLKLKYLGNSREEYLKNE